MLILLNLILQLQYVSGYCNSKCNQSESQSYRIDCRSEENEDIEDQSFCDLWNAQMCGKMNEERSSIDNAIKDVLEMELNYTNFQFEWNNLNFLTLKFLDKRDMNRHLEIICEWKKCNINETDPKNYCNKKCKSCLYGYFDEFHCEACNKGFYLYQNTCLKNCPKGTIENSSSNTCDIILSRELDSCSPACGGTCTQSTNGYCSSCAQDYVSDFYNSGLCIQFCEAGLSPTNGACPDPSSTLYDYVFTTEVNPISAGPAIYQYQALVSSAFPTGSLNNNPDGPYPIYVNGFYFPESGTGYIQLPPNSISSDSIILGNHFSISLWVNYKSWANNQYIFAKEGADYTSLSLYISPDTNLHLAYRAFDLTTNTAQQYDDIFAQVSAGWWQLLEIHPDLANSQIGLYFNRGPWYPIAFSSKFLSDTASETFSIAKSFINNGGFYGFLYEFLITWNNNSYLNGYYVFDIRWTCNYRNCLYCGGYSTGYSECIYPCEYNQYWDGSYTCNNCDQDCRYGCVRSGSCNMNEDPLCKEWSGFDQWKCTKCCDKCVSYGYPCQCASEYIYYYEKSDCVSISPKCKTATYVNNGNCKKCAAGNYLTYYSGLCLSNCPATWYFNGKKCKTDFQPYDMIIHYVFNKQTNVIEDSISGFKLYLGSEDTYYPNYDANDPIPVYQQGLYFSGNSYISLPPNPADNRDLLIGDYWTFIFWVRPFYTGDNSYIISKEGTNYTRFALFFTVDMELKMEIIVFDGNTLDTSTLYYVASGNGNWNSWQFVGVRAGFWDSGTNLYIGITINEGYDPSFIADHSFLEDFPREKFTLGRNINENKYYKGFIYEMQMFNNFNEWPYRWETCGCPGCANLNYTDCLIDECDYNQFFNWDNYTCQNCDENCKSCIRNGDCYLNKDTRCSVAAGFDVENCTSCIDGAIGAGEACVCDYRHELSGNVCNPCYYHIQDRNTISYFSEDYITLVIEFDQAVLFSMPSTCDSLFSSSTIAAFGVSPNCYWSDDRMDLYVNLGENAEIVENSTIVFNNGVLMTDVNACGGPITAVKTEVSYKYPKPLIYPIASLFVPYQLYIVCDDLILDATKAKGGYHRPLKFDWNFKSNPLINTLSKNSKYLAPDPYIFIEKSDLNETVGNIALTLTNWLGFSTNISKQINIINSNGLFLYYDASISFELKTSEYKSIEVFASSECEVPNPSDLKYEWSISNKIGPYVNIDEKTLWGAQTIQTTFYSPPSIFGPGLYTFSLKVSDLSTNFSAITKFSLTYLPSDLTIDLPENTSLYYPSDLSISSKVIDPDNIPESITYWWNCTISYNCTYIIRNPKSSKLKVSKSNFKAGATYIFTLTASKSSRESSKAIEIEVMLRNQTKVTFSEIPKYVNTKENFVIWAYPNTTGNYSSYWSIIQGNQYKLMSNISSLSIGFQENTLNPSDAYCIQFTISDHNGISNYKLWFSTNILPTYGILEISPITGTEFSTIFNLTASNFSTADNKILEYQFGYYLNGNEIPLNIKNESSFLYTSLPHASPFLTVFVKVYNKQGSYEVFTQNVIVDEASKMFGDANSQDIIEFPHLINGINKINKQVIGSFASSQSDLEWARDTNLNSTKLLLDSLYYFDTENFQIIIELLSGIMIKTSENDKITENQRDITLLILDTLLEKAKISSVYTRESSVKSITNILDFSASLNASTLYNNPMLIQHINQILTDFLMLASKFIPIGYSLNFDTDYIHIEAKLEAPGSIKTYKSTIEYGGVALPSENNYSLPINTTAILYILLIYDNNSTLSNDNYPRGFEFLIAAITPKDIFPLNIDMSPYDLNLTIPYYGNETNDKINCVFFKNDKWSTDGCKFISYEYPKVLCQCTHTSLYTAGTNLLLWPDSSPAKSWSSPVYYSSGLCGFYYIILIFLYFIESKRKKNKITLIGLKSPKIQPITIKNNESIENINEIYKFSTGLEENHQFNRKMSEGSENFEFESASINNKKLIINTKNPEETEPPQLTTHAEHYEMISFKSHVIEMDDEERKSCIWHFRYHYFISFIFFSIPAYSRSARFSLFITSLMLQIFLCGIFIDFYGSDVPSSENSDFIDIYFGYSQICFACAAAVMANVIVINISLLLSKKRSRIYPEFGKKSRKKNIRGIVGYGICIFIITINVVATYFLANDIDGNSAKIWMKMILTSLAFDSIGVQGVKVLASLLIKCK